MLGKRYAIGFLVVVLAVGIALAGSSSGVSEPNQDVRDSDRVPKSSGLWSPKGLFDLWAPEDEIVVFRTENSKTFDNYDGTRTLVLGSVFHRMDESGNWVDLRESEVRVSNTDQQLAKQPATRSCGRRR